MRGKETRAEEFERLRREKIKRDLEPPKPIQVKVSGSWLDGDGFGGFAFFILVLAFFKWGGFEALASLIREVSK